MHGQVGQERLDRGFGRAKVVARPQAVETDEAYAPLHLGAFGMHGGVVETEHASNFIEECGVLTSCRVRPIRSPLWRPEITDNRHRANLPENPTNIALSGLLATFGDEPNRVRGPGVQGHPTAPLTSHRPSGLSHPARTLKRR